MVDSYLSTKSGINFFTFSAKTRFTDDDDGRPRHGNSSADTVKLS